ncbi:hypothetical protein C0Q70_09734 [Pomacea canaliculata]|uniref:BMP and activin membrane-bound inhibitor homolog n=1 Tax=Pomacea canaliculata TaxID=400727 RepID=A0A2T7PAN1_POMCA|nr:hypothetical protein C0Q70_09734 [Pomacea canaliculata]
MKGGELRCYCNESGCVSTGYMCKSAAGQCFTAVEVQGDKTRATHGCLDSVPLEHRGMCGGRGAVDGGEAARHERHKEEVVKGGTPAQAGGGAKFPLLICCEEDMCNYIENLDLTNIVMAPKANGSAQKGGSSSEKGIIYSRNPEEQDAERDLWFKAAVIAVPIAGGFILVLLVLLAVRMLRTDNQRHRRLIQIRRERSLTKAQLYVTDHFSDVSAKSDVGKSYSLFASKPHGGAHGGPVGAGVKPHSGGPTVAGGKGLEVGMGLNVGLRLGGGKPVCRDVNISVDKEGRVYEKVCDVNVHRQPQHPSVVRWGHSSKADHATVV